jgi:type IV secretion system protein VirB9
VYSLQFRYPVVPELHTNVQSVAEQRLDGAAAVKNSDYWFCGPASLRPNHAYDDGLQLRLSFPAQMEWPTVYEASPDGSEALVNTHTEKELLVIHHLAERFILRRGREVGCVVNRHAHSAAQRATSGTVLDSVERTTRGVQP